MSVLIDAPAQAAIDSDKRGVAWLCEMDFSGGTLYYTTAPKPLTIGSNTYIGLGNLAGVGPINETESPNMERLKLMISVVDKAMLAATVGNVDTYRGKAVRLYLQFFDHRFKRAGDPVPRWSGYMDKVVVTRKRSDPSGGPSTGTIEMHCSRAGMARARNYQGLRITHQQHQIRFPGDRGLEYMQSLIDNPPRWLSRRFQEI